jgi:sarcosine oxidase, subunit beta
MERASTVVIGGGIIGVSVLWRLAEAGCRDLLLLETEKGLGTGTTAAAVGGYRLQTGDPVLGALTRRSLDVYESFEQRCGRPIDLRRCGYLMIAATDDGWTTLRERAAVDREAAGASVELLDPDELAQRWPGLRSDDLRGGTFCGQDGVLDPAGAVEGFARAARRLGARIELERRVTGLVVRRGRIEGVRTDRGEIACESVVLAAGPPTGGWLEELGVPLPLRPLRRWVFVVDPTDTWSWGTPFLFCADLPFYALADSATVLVSAAEELEPDAPNAAEQVCREVAIERALHRLPGLASCGLRRSWTGLRVLTPDHRPLVGPVPGARGLFVANGFRGKGVTHAPEVARLVADLVCGRDPGDLAPLLAPARFQA